MAIDGNKIQNYNERIRKVQNESANLVGIMQKFQTCCLNR